MIGQGGLSLGGEESCDIKPAVKFRASSSSELEVGFQSVLLNAHDIRQMRRLHSSEIRVLPNLHQSPPRNPPESATPVDFVRDSRIWSLPIYSSRPKRRFTSFSPPPPPPCSLHFPPYDTLRSLFASGKVFNHARPLLCPSNHCPVGPPGARAWTRVASRPSGV